MCVRVNSDFCQFLNHTIINNDIVNDLRLEDKDKDPFTGYRQYNVRYWYA